MVDPEPAGAGLMKRDYPFASLEGHTIAMLHDLPEGVKYWLRTDYIDDPRATPWTRGKGPDDAARPNMPVIVCSPVDKDTKPSLARVKLEPGYSSWCRHRGVPGELSGFNSPRDEYRHEGCGQEMNAAHPDWPAAE